MRVTMVRGAVLACLAAVALLTAVLLEPSEATPDDDDARAAAVRWVGVEGAEDLRRDEDGWEVDVRRPDGSVVEISLGPDLELRELDEERGPGSSPAHDEVSGSLRYRAIVVALGAAGGGIPRGVEREKDGSLEVGVLQADQRTLEVELDPALRVTDTEEEHVLDE